MGDIGRGRLTQDKDNVGGLRAVYFTKLNESDPGLGITYTSNSDEIATLVDAATTFYKYDLQGTSTFDETENNSRDNGTVFYEQVLTLNLKKLTKEDNDDLYNLATSRWHIVVEDKNGNYRLVGNEYGAEKSGGTSSGASMGDTSGYSYVFTAMEKKPANFIVSTWTADSNVTITSGT